MYFKDFVQVVALTKIVSNMAVFCWKTKAIFYCWFAEIVTIAKQLSLSFCDHLRRKLNISNRAERGWAGKRAVRSCWMCDAGVWPGYKGAMILRPAQFKSLTIFSFSIIIIFVFGAVNTIQLQAVLRTLHSQLIVKAPCKPRYQDFICKKVINKLQHIQFLVWYRVSKLWNFEVASNCGATLNKMY